MTSEPRLAFIGCETTSTLSSPLSLSGGHGGQGGYGGKRPSLSDRYPTSPSRTSSSEGSKEGFEDQDQDLNLIEDNLDIISIITDGMN